MNKYYIGYPIPQSMMDIIESITSDMSRFWDMQAQDPKQLHITACYIGETTRDEAVDRFQVLGDSAINPIKPISVTTDRFGKFGHNLVIILKNNLNLYDIYCRLHYGKGKNILKEISYTPHITIVKSGKWHAHQDQCPKVTFDLTQIALFEKQAGGEYEPYMIKEFK